MGDKFLINIRIISICTIEVTIYSKTYNLLISILTAITNCFLNKLVETAVKHNFYINCNKISFNKRTYHVFIL